MMGFLEADMGYLISIDEITHIGVYSEDFTNPEMADKNKSLVYMKNGSVYPIDYPLDVIRGRLIANGIKIIY